MALAVLACIGLGFALALVTGGTPASAATTTVMTKGQKLGPGHAVRSAEVNAACDSYYWELRLQTNGNLVERQVFPCLGTQAVYWQTHTSQKPKYLLLNSVGDLVLVNTSGNRVWQTDTGGLGVTHLAIGSDGNMRMLNSNGGAEWSSRWGICSKQPLSNGKASTEISAACRLRGKLTYCHVDLLKHPGTTCTDCSGLTRDVVYQATYTTLPWSAAMQFGNYPKHAVSWSNLKPGDLVFYRADGTDQAPGHVGIYLGVENGRRYMIDSDVAFSNNGFRHTNGVDVVPLAIEPSPYVGARRFG